MDLKRSRSRQSAEIISGNDDLLTEIILLRLPARSLMRFKSVSKQWQSLISTPPFAVAHTNHHCRRREKLPSFILGTATRSPEFFYFNPTARVFLPHTFQYAYTRILQSSHGLLLLECRNSWRSRVSYCVYNPTTKQSREVEFDEYDGGDDSSNGSTLVCGLALFFDPSISPHYQIICTRRTNSADSFNFRIEIYDSEFHRWENNTTGIYHNPSNMKFWNGISCNNGIYWIRTHHSSTSYYFNFETRRLEVMSPIRVPRRTIRATAKKYYIVESNGHLHCVSTYFAPKFKYLVVYDLPQDHNSSCVEKYRADLNPFPEIKDRPLGLVGIVRGDKEEDSSVLVHAPGMIVRYWFSDKRFEVLCNFERSKIYKKDELQFETNSCCQFVDSLAPV